MSETKLMYGTLGIPPEFIPPQLSRREQFAAMAMQGLLADSRSYAL